MRLRNEPREATQNARILAWARAGRIVHQDDWYNAGADGGGPVKAVRSRIAQLERQGYGFHHTRRRDGTTQYELADDPGGALSRSSIEPSAVAPPHTHRTPKNAHARAAGAVDCDEPPRLFDPPAPAPLNAALHDVDRDAA
jgi:hypothetical protein